MIQTIQFILTSVGIGMLFSIPGILLGYYLKKNNIAPNRSWLTIILCIISTFAKRIWLPDLSYYWFALFLLLGSTLGIYRMDIHWAITSKKS
jgi:uncharacterized membrane protein